jgi:hypothetical protein
MDEVSCPLTHEIFDWLDSRDPPVESWNFPNGKTLGAPSAAVLVDLQRLFTLWSLNSYGN